MRYTIRSRGRVSALLLVLLSGAFLIAAALIVVIGLRPSGGAEKGAGPGPSSGAATQPQEAEHHKPKLAELQDGQVVTRAQAEEHGVKPVTPSKAVDTSRIAATYQAGRTYRSLLKVSVKARASNKDWGVVADTNFHYCGEAEILRHIDSNDGRTMVVTQEFKRARNLSVFTQVDGLRIELGGAAQTLLDLGGTALGADPGWTEYTIPMLNTILSNNQMLSFLSEAAKDPTAKAFAHVDSLQGKKCRVTYVNGEGVTSITPLGCSLTGDEQSMVFATCLASDAYILPDLQCKEGDTWTVQGEDLLPILDPSLRATLTGALTAQRGAEGGTPDRRTAQINLQKGILDLQDADGSTATTGRWAPRGTMTFSFADRIVTQGDLGGSLMIDRRSTNHILFEARYSVKPEYRIIYSCEIAP